MCVPTKLAIQSSFVCIGTLRCSVIKPTCISSDYIILNIKEHVSMQRLSLQIAFKHILVAQLSFEGQYRGLVLSVNHYCARRIRESLSMDSGAWHASNGPTPYFDPEGPHYCQRFIVIDINACGREDLTKLHKMLCDVHRRKAEGSLMSRSGHADQLCPKQFIATMGAGEYERLLRELGDATTGSQTTLPLRQQPSNAIASPAHLNVHVPIIKRRSMDPMEGERESKQSRGRSSRPASPPIIGLVPRSTFTLVTSPAIQNCLSSRLVPAVETRMAGCEQMVGWMPVASTSNAVVRSPNPNGSIRNGSAARTPLPSMEGSDANRRMTKLAAQRKVVHTIEEEEDETLDQKKALTDNGPLLVYPQEGKSKVSLHFADVELLKPEQMVNDTIIDFHLACVHCEMVPQHRRDSVFIFNSFFYSKLTSSSNGMGPPRRTSSRTEWIANNYKSVRTWTKNVDLFSKECIVVPINEDIHWYLAIIMNPSAAIKNKANEDVRTRRKTHIIILDSLIDGLDLKRRLTASILREYLCCEYNDKRKPKAPPEETFVKDRVQKITPHGVPQQRNYTDCGLFLLKFAECFLTNPPMLVARSENFLRWYPRFTIRTMRTQIRNKVQSLCSPEKWKQFESYSGARLETTFQSDEMNSTDNDGLLPFRSPSPAPRLRSYSTGDEESERPVNIQRPLTP